MTKAFCWRAAAAALAAFVAIGGISCQRQPNAEERTAIAASLASKSAALREAQPDLAVLLAAQAYQMVANDSTRQALESALEANSRSDGLLSQPEPVRAVAYAANGSLLITAGEAGTICRWMLAKRTPSCFQLSGGNVELRSLAVSPGASLSVAVSDSSGHVRYVDFSSGAPAETSLGPGNAVAFSPDATTLAAAQNSGNIRLTSFMTGQPLPDADWSGNRAAGHNVGFTQDGSSLVSVDDSGFAVAYDTSTGKARVTHPFATVGPPLTAMGAPDLVAVSGAGETTNVAIWGVRDGKVVNVHLNGGTVPTSLAFAPDGRMLAVASAGGEITFWNVADGAALGIPIRSGADPVEGIAFSPGGENFAVATSRGARLFRREPAALPDASQWVALACQIAGRNLTHAEWKQSVSGKFGYQKACSNLPPPGDKER